MSAIRRLSAILSLSLFVLAARAQPVSDIPAAKESKPYKVLTSGKQVTIKSTKGIKQVMVWSTNGNRIVEHRAVNNSLYSFTVPSNHKTCYIMVGLDDGKVYTEKIGIP